MSQAQLFGALRPVLQAIIAWLLARGFIDSGVGDALLAVVASCITYALARRSGETAGEMIVSLVRHVLAFVGSYAAFRGWVPKEIAGEAGQLAPLIVSLGSAWVGGVAKPAGEPVVPPKLLVLIALLPLAGLLAGCEDRAPAQSSGASVGTRLDAAVAKASASETFKGICANYRLGDVAFVLATLTGRIPDSVIAAERQAVAELDTLCADPPQNIVQAAAAANRIWTRIENLRRPS